MEQEIMKAIPRERFYDDQVLYVTDFDREHAFHVLHRELQTRLFYTPGVVTGLAVQPGGAEGQVVITFGVAIDGQGRQIVMADSAKLDGGKLAPQAAGFVISVNDPKYYTAGQQKTWLLVVEADPNPDASNDLWIENPNFKLLDKAAAKPTVGQVSLAFLTVTAT